MDTVITRHPWNVGFEWNDVRGPGRRLTVSEIESFNTNGFLILKASLPVELIDQVRAVTDAIEAGQDAELVQLGGRSSISERGAITFNAHLVARSDLLRSFAKGRLFADLAADLVGPDVNLYWDQAVYKKPEKPRRFPWHQDNGYHYVEPQQYLTCWVPLVEATVENGCPQLVPGLHRMGTLEHTYVDPLGWECFSDAPSAVVPAPVEPGDVLAFSSLTPHLTGPNLTTGVRKAYILQYAPAGAAVLTGDPTVGPPSGRTPCDDPERQFPILLDGRPQD
jgi:phytanoyl-CoA hydroxylase